VSRDGGRGDERRGHDGDDALMTMPDQDGRPGGHGRRLSTCAICSSVRILFSRMSSMMPRPVFMASAASSVDLSYRSPIERRDGADAVVHVVLEDLGFAVMPSTQCTRSVRAALMNMVWLEDAGRDDRSKTFS